MKITALALTLTFAGASTAAAASITIDSVQGTTYTTAGVSDHSVVSTQMNGMRITAYWTVDGGAQTSQTKVWNNGVAFGGSSFDLVVSGDTFNTDAWELDFNPSGTGRLQRLVFDGVPGNTVFDRTSQGAGTIGSDLGKDLDGFGPYCAFMFIYCLDQGDISVTYFNQVVVGGNAFAGDLYAGVQIDFLSRGGLEEGYDWRFSLDTDIATTQLVDSNGIQTAVPEPGSLLLLGTGLFGLAVAARRRLRA